MHPNVKCTQKIYCKPLSIQCYYRVLLCFSKMSNFYLLLTLQEENVL